MERQPSGFGNGLQRYMAYMYLNQAALADHALHIPRQTLSGYMPTGKTLGTPTYAELLDIADKLGLDLDWLCGRLQSETPVWSPAIRNARADLRALAQTISVATRNERVREFCNRGKAWVLLLGEQWFTAAVLGLDANELRAINRGEGAVTPTMTERLEHLTGIPADWFLTGNAALVAPVAVDGEWAEAIARCTATGITPVHLHRVLSAISEAAASIQK